MKATSVKAYHEIKDEGLLGKLRWTVYDYVFHNGPVTMMQANIDLNTGRYSNGSFTSRFSELRDLGVIEEAGTIVCPHTGRTAIVWVTTDKVPAIKTKKEKSRMKLLIARKRMIKSKKLFAQAYRQYKAVTS